MNQPYNPSPLLSRHPGFALIGSLFLKTRPGPEPGPQPYRETGECRGQPVGDSRDAGQQRYIPDTVKSVPNPVEFPTVHKQEIIYPIDGHCRSPCKIVTSC